jgi:hypothetical protein
VFVKGMRAREEFYDGRENDDDDDDCRCDNE